MKRRHRASSTSLLARPPDAGSLTVQFGEVGPSPPVERIAGRRVALPQRVIDLAVHTANRLPFIEDCPQPVTGDLPLCRVGGQLLGFGGQRLFTGGLGGSMFLASGAVGGSDDLRAITNACQPVCQRVDIAQHACRRQRFGQRDRMGFDLACVAGAGRQPLVHQHDFGAQVIESPAEMGKRGFGIAGLPGADDTLAARTDQPHRAVVVDTAETVRVAGRVRTHRVGGGSRHRPGAGTRSRAGHRRGSRLGGRPGRIVAAGLVGRHALVTYLATLRAYAAHLPREAAPMWSARCPHPVLPPFPTVLKQVLRPLDRLFVAIFADRGCHGPVLFRHP
ncbi:Uncharacterised protein [Mycobacterium tuberculosis]|nr:Uncharacterised protein [Mycobacterium tuberculosis]